MVGHRPHAVAVANARFPTDDFIWQWVQLNVAHRTLKQLVPDASWKVARQHHGFACAYLLRPEQWQGGVDPHKASRTESEGTLCADAAWRRHSQSTSTRGLDHLHVHDDVPGAKTFHSVKIA